MDPAQPADRVPADSTPPDGQPPVTPAAGTPAPGSPDDVAGRGEPALVESGPAAPDTVGEAALVPPAVSGDQAAPPPGRDRARSERSPKDMAISLLVLLVPIALLFAFYRGFLGGEQPTTVDPAPAIEQARTANVFPVLTPQGLGSGWQTVNATFRQPDGGSTLRIGYLSPEGRGAQVVQSDVPPERLLPTELTTDGQPQGQVDLNGRSWQRYTARGNEQALVLLEPGRTVIVVGDVRERELRELAGALR